MNVTFADYESHISLVVPWSFMAHNFSQ